MNTRTSICSPASAAGPLPPRQTAFELLHSASGKNGSPLASNGSGKSPATAQSKPSRRKNMQDESGCLPGVLHASPPLLPASAEARLMTAGSGTKLLTCVKSSSPLGLFLKTLLESTAWGSTESFLTWKGSATKLRHSVYQLVPSIRRRTGTGFGLSATAKTGAGGNVSRGHDRKDELLLAGQLKAALLPTARASDDKQSHQKDSHGLSIPEAMRRAFWPTPKSQYGGPDYAAVNRGKTEMASLPTALGRITNGSSSTTPFTVVQLTFTAWLMGLPLEYLESFVHASSPHSATRSTGKSQRTLSAQSKPPH